VRHRREALTFHVDKLLLECVPRRQQDAIGYIAAACKPPAFFGSIVDDKLVRQTRKSKRPRSGVTAKAATARAEDATATDLHGEINVMR